MAAKQVGMFFAPGGDVPLRDDQEALSVPMVSLSKGRRTAPIEWQSSDGDRYVRVTANATHGMATIWDWDVLIWAISQINAIIDAGKPVFRELYFQPHVLLKGIQRGVSGKHYQELEAALTRLTGTLVETNIRTKGNRRKSSFHLLEEWEHDTDATTGRSRGMKITLPQWIFDGVMSKGILAVPLAYFDLSSGIARFLYRIARRHGGRQSQGFSFTMKNLHARSGSMQPLNQFARDVRRVVKRQGVPEYQLGLFNGQHGDEWLKMVRDPVKAALL